MFEIMAGIHKHNKIKIFKLTQIENPTSQFLVSSGVRNTDLYQISKLANALSPQQTVSSNIHYGGWPKGCFVYCILHLTKQEYLSSVT